MSDNRKTGTHRRKAVDSDADAMQDEGREQMAFSFDPDPEGDAAPDASQQAIPAAAASLSDDARPTDSSCASNAESQAAPQFEPQAESLATSDELSSASRSDVLAGLGPIDTVPPTSLDAQEPVNAAALSGVAMLAILRDWADRGWLRELDRAFAAFLAEQVPGVPALLLLGAALASHQLGRGHVCVTLADTLADPRFALSLPPDERGAWSTSDAPTETHRVVTPDVLLDGIDVAQWRAALTVPGLVMFSGTDGTDGIDVHDAADKRHASNETAPLVLVVGGDGGAHGDGDVRLYLRRYWRYEQQVRSAILQRVAAPADGMARGDNPLLRGLLACLFPPSNRLPEGAADWQKLACALMTRRRFGIVTGGPGTGKTTTVVRLLALLQCLAISDGAPALVPDASQPTVSTPLHGDRTSAAISGGRTLRIRLAAPTGKAAARLNDAIARAVRSLPLAALAALLPSTPTQTSTRTGTSAGDDAPPFRAGVDARVERLQDAIPTEVTTLHRLLGSRPDSRRFRHDADTPLALDVLVIDEASMVDLEMMAAVLAALPPTAHLILLGDKDQLASVEAGAVLGELCARAQQGHYTPTTCEWIAAATGASIDVALRDPSGTALDQSIAMLRHSHRFTAESGIGRLAQAVNDGDAAALRRIRAMPFQDLAYVSLAAESSTQADAHTFRRLVIDGTTEGGTTASAPPSTSNAVAASSERPSAPSGPYGYAHYLRVLRDTAPAGVLNAQGTQAAGDAAATAVSPSKDGRAAHAHDTVTTDDAHRMQQALLRTTYDDWARAVLDAYSEFQMLCALRHGAWGVDGLNERIATTLHEAGLIALPSMRQVRAPTPWYVGRPVLVTRNDYGLGLMNGDVGITLIGPPQERIAGATSPSQRHLISGDDSIAADRQSAAAERGGEALSRLRVAFLASDGSREVKWVLPSRLQAVETVFAMTVHKSQGSEFNHAALILPPRMNPILTRELVYTGMTRARRWLTLASAARDDHVLMQSIARRVLRASGLMR
jgi:exodeoxyribonuclease V alpha subunit